MRMRLLSIFVLVLIVSIVMVTAAVLPNEPVEINVDIDAGACCASVDYRFNRATNMWEYNGRLNWGFDPVTELSSDVLGYNEGYRQIAKKLATFDELTGYYYFNEITKNPPTNLGNSVEGVTIDGIPSLPPPPPTPTVVQKEEAPEEEAKPVEEPRREERFIDPIGNTPYIVDENGVIQVCSGNDCRPVDESTAEYVRNNLPDYAESLARAKSLAEQDVRTSAEERVPPPSETETTISVTPTAGVLTASQKELIAFPEIIAGLEKNGVFVDGQETYYRTASGEIILVSGSTVSKIPQRGEPVGFEGSVRVEGEAVVSGAIETLEPVQVIPICDNDCTIANSVITNENERQDRSTTPPVVFINGKTHEPFWNGEEWDYCRGEGCSETALTKLDHAAIAGGETIIIDPKVNEIGTTGYYVDEFDRIYTCPEATESCRADAVISQQVRGEDDYEESLDAIKKKAETKVEEKAEQPQAPPRPQQEPSDIKKIQSELSCFQQGRSCKGPKKTVGEAYAELDGIATEREKDVQALSSEVEKLRQQVDAFPPGLPSDEEKEVRKKLQAAVDDLNKAEKDAKEYREAADSLEGKRSWLDTWKSGDAYKEIVASQELIDKFGMGLQQFGQYQALSNLILPDATKKFVDATNQGPLNAWADLPGYASRELCEAAFIKNRKTPGQSAARVQTAAGTYQFVGSIQAEKSTARAPIFCQKRPVNESEDAEEEFFCKGNLVCKEDGFCYQNANARTPELGTFYKIVWGVTAPSDEKSTPYVDEDGKAVKFNLQLVGGSSPWLFKRGRLADDSVLELTNGARDGGTIVHFSEIDYTEVCIRFDDRYRVKDYFQGEVKEICTPFVETNRGSVEFAESDRTAPGTSAAAAEVTLDTEW